MALYGHEIHASITPWEADLGWIVKMDKGDFVGPRRAGEAERAGRHAQAGGIRNDAAAASAATATKCIMDGVAGGLGDQRRTVAHSEQKHRTCVTCPPIARRPGQPIQIMIRNQPVEAVTVPTPFYKRAK